MPDTAWTRLFDTHDLVSTETNRCQNDNVEKLFSLAKQPINLGEENWMQNYCFHSPKAEPHNKA